MICFMLYNIIYNDTLYDIYVMIKISGMKLKFYNINILKNFMKGKILMVIFFFFCIFVFWF